MSDIPRRGLLSSRSTLCWSSLCPVAVQSEGKEALWVGNEGLSLNNSIYPGLNGTDLPLFLQLQLAAIGQFYLQLRSGKYSCPTLGLVAAQIEGQKPCVTKDAKREERNLIPEIRFQKFEV